MLGNKRRALFFAPRLPDGHGHADSTDKHIARHQFTAGHCTLCRHIVTSPCALRLNRDHTAHDPIVKPIVKRCHARPVIGDFPKTPDAGQRRVIQLQARRVIIEEVRHNTQKEKRIIDTLEPVMNQHRLVVNQSLITKDFRSTDHLPTEEALSYQLFYQMTRITRQRGALIRDDRLDAVAMAVAYWVEQMASDVDSQAKASEEAWLDQQVKEFIDHCSGGRLVGNPSWLDGPGRRSGSRLPL